MSNLEIALIIFFIILVCGLVGTAIGSLFGTKLIGGCVGAALPLLGVAYLYLYYYYIKTVTIGKKLANGKKVAKYLS